MLSRNDGEQMALLSLSASAEQAAVHVVPHTFDTSQIAQAAPIPDPGYNKYNIYYYEDSSNQEKVIHTVTNT